MKGKICKVKHIQGITFTHLKSNNAQLYKENKNIKYNMQWFKYMYYIEELCQRMKRK